MNLLAWLAGAWTDGAWQQGAWREAAPTTPDDDFVTGGGGQTPLGAWPSRAHDPKRRKRRKQEEEILLLQLNS